MTGGRGSASTGAGNGNRAILDVARMRWLRFRGKSISNALRSLMFR